LRIGTVAEGVIRSEWLMAGAVSEPFPLAPGLAQPRSTARVFLDYVALGYTHILPKGLDHILFVLGIFLLSLHWRPLLYQVTAFTVAHSITLGLSLYGFISLPSTVVEPLIALSIVYVAVENIVTPVLKPWRIYVVFCFGLLHGMGFAGVLKELGLPRAEFATALVAFNVGVELGQLSVITLAFLAVGVWCRHRSWYRMRVEIPGSAMIALVGAYWTVQRILG
jgi:hydrogenase/urease accessory protein HupE